MPVPKRRTGKTRKRTRRAHQALSPVGTIESPDTGERVLPHRVDMKTGMYKGRQVMKVKD